MKNELNPLNKTDNLYFCELDFNNYYIRLTDSEVDNLF